jgi:serine/threonine protein phosphatase 1
MIECILIPDGNDHLIFLGDFINKGPSSGKVLDYLVMLERKGIKISSVMGNHEKLLLDMYYGSKKIPEMFRNEKIPMLKSFDVESIQDIPGKYIEFIEKLSPYLIVDDYVIVHAGINFSAEDPWNDYQSMYTLRNYQVTDQTLEYRKIIHGHQASPLKDILIKIMDEYSRTINLDNGCVYTWREGMGNLVVLNLTNMSIHIQPCLD